MNDLLVVCELLNTNLGVKIVFYFVFRAHFVNYPVGWMNALYVLVRVFIVYFSVSVSMSL